MNTFLKWIKNPTVQKITLLLVIFILCAILFKDCGRTLTDDRITKLEQNIAAFKDTLIIERNKVGEWQAKHAVIAATAKDLKILNEELYNEVQKQKGNVIYLSKINAQLEQKIKDLQNTPDDPDNITVNVNNDGTQTVNWKYDTVYSKGNERHMVGTAKIGFMNDTAVVKTYITDKGDTLSIRIPLIDKDDVIVNIPKDIIKMTLVTGLERDEKDDVLRIFVRSSYPGFQVTDLEGAIIDPQKDELIKSYFPRKRFVIGTYGGIGATFNMFDNYKPAIGPSIGISLTYKIFEF